MITLSDNGCFAGPCGCILDSGVQLSNPSLLGPGEGTLCSWQRELFSLLNVESPTQN